MFAENLNVGKKIREKYLECNVIRTTWKKGWGREFQASFGEDLLNKFEHIF